MVLSGSGLIWFLSQKTAYHKTNTSYHQSYLVSESWNMIPHKPHKASLLHGVIWFWSYLVLVKTGECDKLYWCYVVWLSYLVWKWWNIITHKPHNASYIHGVIWFWSYLVPIPKTAYHKTNTSYHQSYLVWESWNMITHKPHNASYTHGVIWFWSYLVLV